MPASVDAAHRTGFCAENRERSFFEKSLVKNFTTRQFRGSFRAPRQWSPVSFDSAWTRKRPFTLSRQIAGQRVGAEFRHKYLSVKYFLNALLISAWLLAMPEICRGAEGGAEAKPVAVVEGAGAHQAAEHSEHSLPPNAVVLREKGFVTNSMLVTWIVAIGLIAFAQIATRNVQQVPSGLQNFWEFLVEGLYGFLEGIVGAQLIKKTFWFFATIFIFILFTNWFGLLPGVGTVGWGEQTSHGFVVTRPLLRGGNADLNMTFAMAAIFMVLWLIWSLQVNGVKGFLLHIFGPKGDNVGFIKYMMILVFFVVGFLEVISIAFRPVSLSFRLYGNVFAGENLLEAIANTVQHPAWAKHVFAVLLPVPFYFLEILIGLVQAFVFMLLTTVFTALMCEHEEEPGKAHH